MKILLMMVPLLTLASAGIASAQRAVTFGVAVEAASPVGGLNRAFGLGYGLEAFANRDIASLPLSVGLGIGYRRLPASTTWHMSLTNVEATADYNFTSAPLSPFVTVGPGFYSVSPKATQRGTANGVEYSPGSYTTRDFGIVFGAGFNLSTRWARIPVAMLVHTVPGLSVGGGTVRFSTLSLGVAF